MSTSRTSAKRMQAAERRAQVVTMRMAGYTQRDIAAKLGVALSTVCKDLKHALNEYASTTAEAVEEMRTIDNARIEEMIKALWVRVKSGNLGSIDRLIRLLERRARLNGLDGALKFAPTDPTGQNPYRGYSDEELLREIAAIASGQTET